MQMHNRTATISGKAYRFAFNGKELDREHGGAGNVYDYGFRIYNPSLGRFLSTDPLSKDYSWLTPYQFGSNNPIAFVDLDGLEAALPDITVQPILTVDFHSDVLKPVVLSTTIMNLYGPPIASPIYNRPGWFRGFKERSGRALRSFIMKLSGFINSTVSNNFAGGGRINPNSLDGYSYDDKVAFSDGQFAGDVFSLVQGVGEMTVGGLEVIGGTTVTVGSGGVGGIAGVAVTELGVVTVAHGGSVVYTSWSNLNNPSLYEVHEMTDQNTPRKEKNKGGTKSNTRLKDQKKGDASSQQYEGITRNQSNKKKEQKGNKQNSIQSTRKSKQREQNTFDEINNLDDAKDYFDDY